MQASAVGPICDVGAESAAIAEADTATPANVNIASRESFNA